MVMLFCVLKRPWTIVSKRLVNTFVGSPSLKSHIICSCFEATGLCKLIICVSARASSSRCLSRWRSFNRFIPGPIERGRLAVNSSDLQTRSQTTFPEWAPLSCKLEKREGTMERGRGGK